MESILEYSSVHLVGIGGTGMSGLAQLLAARGLDVGGSDRSFPTEDSAGVFAKLAEQGIRIFPQDGSYASDSKPDLLIYSSAIEEDNPDFAVSPRTPRMHRADALLQAIDSRGAMRTSIAVSGTSGKTSVSAWLAETLFRMGRDPEAVCGGAINFFQGPSRPGNYLAGNGPETVYEADESDKSLLGFRPDIGVVLNIGDDHYPRSELRRVFRDFARNVSDTLVFHESLAGLFGDIPGIKKTMFGKGDYRGPERCWSLRNHCPKGKISEAVFMSPDGREFKTCLPVPGKHNAMNAAATLAVTDVLDIETEKVLDALSRFEGVERRFQLAGDRAGIPVYDDYAHNPDKIRACLETAAGVCRGKVIALFQPHGYAPLGFMKNALLEVLKTTLREEDLFIFLPVYYAGGTSSFSPESEDVVREFRGAGLDSCMISRSREDAAASAAEYAEQGDSILVMGARDHSLAGFARKISCLIGKQNYLSTDRSGDQAG